jgi:hypothetical protein
VLGVRLGIDLPFAVVYRKWMSRCSFGTLCMDLGDATQGRRSCRINGWEAVAGLAAREPFLCPRFHSELCCSVVNLNTSTPAMVWVTSMISVRPFGDHHSRRKVQCHWAGLR